MTLKNGYGKPLKAGKINLYNTDTEKIARIQTKIQALVEQLPLSSNTTPTTFTPAELARVHRAQRAADLKAFNIEAKIAKLNQQINQETKKATTSGRKNHGQPG
jgi:hypothetical protein